MTHHQVQTCGAATRVFPFLLWGLIALFSIQSFEVLAAAGRTDRSAYVHLFEWRWKDIALECEKILGPKGFAGVQVSPPNEHVILPQYPWYQRYQLVSYKLESRSGNREEFIDMVHRCKAVGVDVYVDAIMNHMTWVNRSGTYEMGFVSSLFGAYDYPGLYAPEHFHRCGRNGDNSIQNYQDRWEVQNCDLSQLADLKTEDEYVRDRLAAYLTDLMNIGVAGFRVDAAKHIPASDLAAIYAKVGRPFYAFLEVIDFGGEPISAKEYMGLGDITEFRYSRNMSYVFNHGKLDWLSQFGEAWGMMPSDRVVVFLDNHDTQRGHGAGGEVLTYRDGQKYALASAFMLAWPYGNPQIMSSYRFTTDFQGPPSAGGGTTAPIYLADGKTDTCGTDWQCEHRWPMISNMVAFRNAVGIEPVQRWYSDGGQLISFARGTKGYAVFNHYSYPVRRWYDTGLVSGHYCELVSGGIDFASGKCNGKMIEVGPTGWAEIEVAGESVVALVVQQSLEKNAVRWKVNLDLSHSLKSVSQRIKGLMGKKKG